MIFTRYAGLGYSLLAFNIVIDDFDLHIFQFKINIVIFGRFLCFIFSQYPCHGFAYQWLDNI